MDYETEPEGHIYGATVSVVFPDWDAWRKGHVPIFHVELDDEGYRALQDERDPSWYETRLLEDAGRPVGIGLRWLDHQWVYNRYAEVWERTAVPKDKMSIRASRSASKSSTKKRATQLDREIAEALTRPRSDDEG